jgi:hypothetical protein
VTEQKKYARNVYDFKNVLIKKGGVDGANFSKNLSM